MPRLGGQVDAVAVPVLGPVRAKADRAGTDLAEDQLVDGADVSVQVDVEGRPVDTDRAGAVMFQPHSTPLTAGLYPDRTAQI